ncbi:Alpha/Beta hydrolase protein [Aspergillus ambiguus]|uniref:alpha/beta hydrolase n=1 Tax=Aspergillus ambiguus TaxID=176160 RepID=UPI003CCDB9E4
MAASTKVQFPSFQLTVAGELHAPAAGAPDRKGAAVVISHPMTGVKEQTSTDYARVLSQAGYYALTFDTAYQGESTGEPRGLEDPHQRVEDVKSAVSYLTTLKGKVDANRIGVVGICASGGYTSYAAQSDVRIKALATVSAACVGRMTRNGGVHENNKENPDAIAGALQYAAQWRTNEASGNCADPPPMFDAKNVPADADPFFKDAAEYYGTERGQHSRSTQKVPLASYDLMVPYDSFNFQHLISPRPLLMIAGSKAQTLHYSRTAVEVAKEPKELFVVEGKNHFDLYDDVTESGPKIVGFFDKYLQPVTSMSSSTSRRIRRPLKAPERPLAIRTEYITEYKTLLMVKPRSGYEIGAGAYKIQDESGINQFIVTGPRDDGGSSRSRRDNSYREFHDVTGLPLFTLPRRIGFQDSWEIKLPGTRSTTVVKGGPRWAVGATFRDWTVTFQNAAALDGKSERDKSVTLHIESHGNILTCYDVVDGDRKVAEVRESIANNRKLALMPESRFRSSYHPVLDIVVVPGVDLSLFNRYALGDVHRCFDIRLGFWVETWTASRCYELRLTAPCHAK